MKVLYVTSNGGIHDYRFMTKLVEDYEVLLLHYSARDLLNEIKNIKGLKIISKKSLVKSFPYLTERKHFRSVYESFKPDVVHTGYVWQVGILAAVNDVHPHLSMPWGSDVLIEPDKHSFIERLVRKVMNQADHVQCDAEFVKRKIINDYGLPESKITVFPIGIDLSLFHPMDRQACKQKVNEGDKFLIHFNRFLEPVYGVKYMLEGFKNFAQDKTDVLLMMFSEGSLLKEVQTFIKNNRLEGKIKLIGRISNNELPEYLNASDVYISTSLSDGTSISMLEAMACGLGMVVSNVPSILEWISEKNGMIVKRKDPQSVTQALNTLYYNRNLIKQHGEKNLSIVHEKADWDKNYMKLREIYKRIYENRN